MGNLPQSTRSTTQIWVVTCHQYGNSALLSQTSFHGETSGGVVECGLFSRPGAFQARSNMTVLCRPHIKQEGATSLHAWTQGNKNKNQHSLHHRCNQTPVSKVCKAAPVSLLWAPNTQRITGYAFWISFQSDWQIHNGLFWQANITWDVLKSWYTGGGLARTVFSLV